MSCPTCDHTMYQVAVMPEPHTKVPLFWCPRCGTLKGNVITERHSVPKLVSRVTEFASNLTDEHEALIAELERLGVREAICLEG